MERSALTFTETMAWRLAILTTMGSTIFMFVSLLDCQIAFTETAATARLKTSRKRLEWTYWTARPALSLPTSITRAGKIYLWFAERGRFFSRTRATAPLY